MTIKQEEHWYENGQLQGSVFIIMSIGLILFPKLQFEAGMIMMLGIFLLGSNKK